MTKCLIYSGYRRSWEFCRGNHAEMIGPVDFTVHRDDMYDLEYYKKDILIPAEKKAPETIPKNTLNQWHNNFMAFASAPTGYRWYIRCRYDIRLDGPVDIDRYNPDDDVVYIPEGNDYRDGVNDQFAFGTYRAMRKYYSVYLAASGLYERGKIFHTESYLKYNLDDHHIRVVRIPVRTEIKRW